MESLTSQIVLLVTKAVGDAFGAHGIADTMIKFNGLPFLEKEDKEGGDRALIEPSQYLSDSLSCSCQPEQAVLMWCEPEGWVC